MTPIPRGLILVGGTWSMWDSWKEVNYPLAVETVEAARSVGIDYELAPETFVWSSEVDGLIGENRVWIGGAHSLGYYRKLYFGTNTPVDIIAHSHGGQVVLEAISKGLVKNVVNVALMNTPKRSDMHSATVVTRSRISKLVYVRGGWRDSMVRLGRIGNFGLSSVLDWDWRIKEADHNFKLKEYGHGDTLRLDVFERYLLPNFKR